MVEVTLVEENGTAHVVQVPSDRTLLDAVLANKIPGIPGDCGGSCACSSCHVIVEAEWIEACGPVDELEDGMLDFAPERQENSRLACQIPISDKIDGMVVKIPAKQY